MSDWPIHARNPIERVAAHEAGHAVVAWFSRTVIRVLDVRLGPPRSGVYGLTVSAQKLDSPLAYWEAVAISMAGLAGERFGLRSTAVSGAEGDVTTACVIAGKLVAIEDAFSSPFPVVRAPADLPFTITIGEGTDPRIGGVITAGYAEAARMIKAHRAEYMRLVGELVCRRRVKEHAFIRMFGDRPWATHAM